MPICLKFPLTEALIESFTAELGDDLPAYRNHVCRVLNYFLALTNCRMPPDSVLVAATFHDIGIWTDHTYDYLEPSVRRAKAYPSNHNRAGMEAEVTAIIREHHKILPYHAEYSANVETFRRADLVDVSLGFIRFGLASPFVRSVKAAFPNQGFHWKLITLTATQFYRTPLRPLPMMHW